MSKTRLTVAKQRLVTCCYNLGVVLLLAGLLSLNLSCESKNDLKAARESARVFHEQFIRHDYNAIYTNASSRFKSIRSQEGFASMMTEITEEYGNLLKVKEESAATIINTNDGKMHILIFHLEFEKIKATERLTFTRDKTGQMRLWMFELS
jgi:hypothetical protein